MELLERSRFSNLNKANKRSDVYDISATEIKFGFRGKTGCSGSTIFFLENVFDLGNRKGRRANEFTQ